MAHINNNNLSIIIFKLYIMYNSRSLKNIVMWRIYRWNWDILFIYNFTNRETVEGQDLVPSSKNPKGRGQGRWAQHVSGNAYFYVRSYTHVYKNQWCACLPSQKMPPSQMIRVHVKYLRVSIPSNPFETWELWIPLAQTVYAYFNFCC